MKKIRVGILFGGKSSEHEVSLLSAKNVIDALDKEKYEPVLVGIDKNGEWHLRDGYQFLLHAEDPKMIQLHGSKGNVALIPKENGNQLVSLSGNDHHAPVDVVFPVLHGSYGEDGTIQGLLKMADIPFVGAGVLGSAVGMDKDVMKRLFITCYSHEQVNFEEVVETIGLPMFVKPANTGSSVGVAKVKNKDQFLKAIEDAFLYDRKVIIEQYIPGREIECSVLGNEEPVASLPGEVIPQHEFYSYEAKYIDEFGAKFQIPVPLQPDLIRRIQHLSIQAFKVLCCEGMARVDFFLQENGDLYINEINTIPGFTKISMYPKLWEVSGLPYPELVDRLIQLALDRHRKERKIKTEYNFFETR
jgi:D-alanine-D-alanine ligase